MTDHFYHFKLRYYIITFIALALNACIEPVNLTRDSSVKSLIVEGTLTMVSKSHSISLTKSAPYGGVFAGALEPVTDALVIIKCSDGSSVPAEHDSSGVYRTPPYYHGEVGKSYSLIIHLGENTYVSTDEFIKPLNKSDSVYLNYNEYLEPSRTDVPFYKTGLDIRARYERQENTSDYYYWEYNSVYLINTATLLHVSYGPGCAPSCPDPKECCAVCFRTEYNRNIVTSSYSLGNDHQDVKLFFIEDDGYRFSDHYTMIVKKYSLTRQAFQFYKQVNQQLKIHGDVFDPPPVTIRGNIYNLNDLNELVVGYFKACDFATDTLRIYPQNLDYVKPEPLFRDDCRVLPNSSTTKPKYY